MSRFDQCTETCTTDCGHCKGRPVEALRYELARAKAKLDKSLDFTESAQKIAAQSIRQRDEAQSLADMMGANVDQLEAEVARLTVERDTAQAHLGALNKWIYEHQPSLIGADPVPAVLGLVEDAWAENGRVRGQRYDLAAKLARQQPVIEAAGALVEHEALRYDLDAMDSDVWVSTNKRLLRELRTAVDALEPR